MVPALPSDIFRTGQVLNNTYEVVGVLGRGGTGEVYLARNQITDRQSAIKALNAQFSGNADYLELMKREEQMRNIIHDAVVRYSECSRTDAGHVFLVMDYIEGPSLNDAMFEAGVDDRDLLIVAHRVLEGLVVTHAQGIVHRDLSPDNIILRGGEPKRATLIDFGIAKDTAAGARTIVGNEFAGKYEYAAPEQLEGHADARSDLYALGTSLLAAHRRDLPKVGTTPGEIVRRKKQPVDTTGVTSPLKDLIDWLTAPEPARRPQSAAAALPRVDSWLKPETSRRIGSERGTSRRRRLLPVVLGAGAAAALAAAFVLGLFDRAPALPVVSPYTFEAADRAAGPTLGGNAPDVEVAAELAAVWADVTGATPPSGALTLAHGMPGLDWPAHVADLMTLAGELQDWALSVSDGTARIEGLADDMAARDAMTAALSDWSTLSGMSVSTELAAGPRLLESDVLQGHLDAVADCGPLKQEAAETLYALGDTIVVTGYTAGPGTVETLRDRLVPLIGDRTLRIETQTLGPDLCAVRAALPQVGEGDASLRLGKGNGNGDEPNLTGIFRTGEYVVAELLLPAGLESAHLWVTVIDNTGRAFHVLPNQNRSETAVADLGTVEAGVRRIPLLGTLEQLRAAPESRGFALRVDDEMYGKSQIVSILSTEPLLDLRPSRESVTAFAEALAERVTVRPDMILGITSRILDLRE